MQDHQTKAKKQLKEKLNPNSPFATLTDEEIALVLSLRAKNLRISQNKKQKEFSQEANLSSTSTYSNFEQKGTISLINFIKVIRTLDRLEEFEKLLLPTVEDKIQNLDKKNIKRVR
jgi:transcriptional regulator with XRE-family HTH domain